MSGWKEIYREIRRRFPGFRRISRGSSEWVAGKLEELRAAFVSEMVGDELKQVFEWIECLEFSLSELRRSLNVEGVFFPHEFRSFVADPSAHLRKKLFIYAMDLARRKLSVKGFERKARQAIQTSLQTNMRNLYQSWVFLTLLGQVGEGGSLIYPEHGFVGLDRSGKQRIHLIPPNAIIQSRRGVLSFFLEAPRPVGWEDTEDLRKTWGLYKAMRPDILVYGGKVMNILEPHRDPPIRRPDIIIECKKLGDWYRRVRELKADDRPLSAEEWRWMWLEGLWRGLGRELGASRPETLERKPSKKVRLREPELVKSYMDVYKPRKMMLITREKTPGKVKENLERYGVEVFDGVGLNPQNLRPVSEIILNYAKPDRGILVLRGDIVRMIEERSRILNKTPEEVVELAIRNLERRDLSY